MNRAVQFFRVLWCDWTHGGGLIKRDSAGRINWQCSKCGRWSSPISLEDEQAMTDLDIEQGKIRP